MKNLLCFLSLIFITAASFGQKNIDLGIELISPASNSVNANLNTGDTFFHSAVVTNYGPDTVVAGQDSMYVMMDVGFALLPSFYAFFALNDVTLLPGQTDTFSFYYIEGQNLGSGLIVNYPVNDTISTWAAVYGKDINGNVFSDPGYTGNGNYIDVDPLNYPGNNMANNTNIIFTSPDVQSISLQVNNNLPPVINTYAGTLQINSTILPAAATQNVTWSISPAGIASLNGSPTSTAILPINNGIVWVKATSVQNPLLSDSIMVTISGQKADSMTVTTVNNAPAIIDSIHHTLQLQAKIYPLGAPQDVVWEIIPVDGAANISLTGLVTATAFGKVWAKAQSVQFVNYADSILIDITNNPLLIDETGVSLKIAIYPNPSNSDVTISFGNAHPDLTISISDIEGKVLGQYKQKGGSNSALHLSMEQYSQGVYFIQFKGEKINLTKKLIKQ